MDVGESIEQAAIREAQEETGLQMTLEPGFKTTLSLPTKQLTYYLGEVDSSSVKLSNEHSKYK